MHKKVNSISFRLSRLNVQGITNNFSINVYPINLQKYNYENMYISFWLQNELRRWRFFPLKLEIARSYKGLLTVRLLVFNRLYYRLQQFFVFFRKFFYRFFVKIILLARFKKIRRVFMRNRRFKLRYRKNRRYMWGITGKILRAFSKKRWFHLFRIFSFYVKNYRIIFRSFMPFLKTIYRLVPLSLLSGNFSVNSGYYFYFLINFTRLSSRLSFIREKNTLKLSKSKKYFFFTMALKKKGDLFLRRYRKLSSQVLQSYLRSKTLIFFNVFNFSNNFFKKSQFKKSLVKLKPILKKKRKLKFWKNTIKGYGKKRFKRLSRRKRKFIVNRFNFKKHLQKNIRLILNYSRIFISNIFCTRIVGLKAYIEKYSYSLFKRPVLVQLFFLNDVTLVTKRFSKKKLDKRISLYSTKKLELANSIPGYYGIFNPFHYFLLKRNLIDSSSYKSPKLLMDTLYSIALRKKDLIFSRSRSTFYSNFIKKNFYREHTSIIKKKRFLQKLDKNIYNNNMFIKKRFKLLSSLYKNSKIINNNFLKIPDNAYLLSTFNRITLKFIIVSAVDVFFKYVYLIISKCKNKPLELHNTNVEKLKTLMSLFVKKKLVSSECLNLIFFKGYLQNSFFIYARDYNLYPSFSSQRIEEKNYFTVSKYRNFAEHYNAVRTLNALNLMHVNPKRYLRTNDYFLKKRIMSVSINKHKNLRRFLKLMLFGLYFGNASIFNQAFYYVFKKLRKHNKFLVFFEQKIIEMYYHAFLKTSVVGFHMRLRGKHDGKTRRSTKWIRFGKPIKGQDMDSVVNYNFIAIPTFTGIFGISTWFVYPQREYANSRENKI